MLKSEAIKFFGGRVADLVDALRKSREKDGEYIGISTAYTWDEYVPRDVALEIERMTNGALPAHLHHYATTDRRRRRTSEGAEESVA